jgi:pilus assembly protein FimV
MDNMMLYIITGLVILLLIGVLILRKNKAQRPVTQLRQASRSFDNTAFDNTTMDRAAHNKDMAPTHNPAVAVGGLNSTKFDNLTIAQRFIDQQRYDKALETLERGIQQTPHDQRLHLKLLNIYVLTKQIEPFYQTYTAIKEYADTATIEQAQQFESLLGQQQRPPVTPSLGLATADKIDLEQPLTIATSKPSTTIANSQQRLEAASLDLNTSNFELSTKPILHLAEQPQTDASIDNSYDNSYLINNKDALHSDNSSALELSFDNLAWVNLGIDNTADTADTADTASSNNDPKLLSPITYPNSAAIEDGFDNDNKSQSAVGHDDFLLDFESFIAGIEPTDPIVKSNVVDSTLELASLTLELDGLNGAQPKASSLRPKIKTLATTTSAPTDFIDFELDNNTPLSNDYTVAAVDDFITDFDFIDILDPYQVSLDLASQYLPLGEYDRAKRLLAEVIAQGNSTQQQQAQDLLTRSS